MSESILSALVRAVTPEDRENLPVFSYTKIDTFKKCPMRYKLQYEDDKRSEDSTLALELGTLCHLVLEIKGKMLTTDGKVDYDALNKVLHAGYTPSEDDDKTTEPVIGIDKLKAKYFEDWSTPDNASGMNYDQKMKLFDKVLHSEMEDDEWEPFLFEHPFEFVYDNRAIFHGFIDFVGKKTDGDLTNYIVRDYKTSKKVYNQQDVVTSMQFGVYALAMLQEFGVLPIEYQYRFILIDGRQVALTKGWEKRLVQHMNKLLDGVEEAKKQNNYKPAPSPLCFWCNFCKQNPTAHQFKDECEYFSLWTPTNKTYNVNKQWLGAPSSKVQPQNNTIKRKIFF